MGDSNRSKEEETENGGKEKRSVVNELTKVQRLTVVPWSAGESVINVKGSMLVTHPSFFSATQIV